MEANQIAQLVQDEIRKAVTQSTYTFSPSDRSIYSPENLDPVVKTVVPTATPVRGFIPRVGGMGEAASFSKLTSGLATTAGTGGTVDYRDWETDRKSTRLNSSHSAKSRMPSSA